MTFMTTTIDGHHSILSAVLAAGIGFIVFELVYLHRNRHHGHRAGSQRFPIGRFTHRAQAEIEAVNDLTELIGNTPLLRIRSLSELTGIEILAKCEFLNPGGSIKDRIALQIMKEAEASGQITPHSVPRCRVFEGTSGSTGISLALVARALGYEAEIVLPDDTAIEKSQLIEHMGATVTKGGLRSSLPIHLIPDNIPKVDGCKCQFLTCCSHRGCFLPYQSPVRPVSISNRSHYVNVARDRAKLFIEQGGKGLFVDQFENPANWLTHYRSTGPEIWDQTRGIINAFVAGAGTGGTLAGVGKFLKSKDPNIQLVLADPPGSGLFNKVKHGVMFSRTEIEGKRRRHQMDTVVEGIGSNRLTGNLNEIIDTVDDAISVTDEEAIKMSRFILKEEGLFLGSSSAVNLVAIYKLAKKDRWNLMAKHRKSDDRHRPNRLTMVTILCDSGQRHLSKFWNDDYLIQNGILRSLPDANPSGLDF